MVRESAEMSAPAPAAEPLGGTAPATAATAATAATSLGAARASVARAVAQARKKAQASKTAQTKAAPPTDVRVAVEGAPPEAEAALEHVPYKWMSSRKAMAVGAGIASVALMGVVAGVVSTRSDPSGQFDEAAVASPGIWVSREVLWAGDPQENALFGSAASFCGNRIVASGPGFAGNETAGIASAEPRAWAYSNEIDGEWTLELELDLAANAIFGTGGGSGSGGPGTGEPDNGPVAAAPGRSVACLDELVAVSAPGQGGALVFRAYSSEDSNPLNATADLVQALDNELFADFGHSLSLSQTSDDKRWLLVGAPDLALDSTGSVHALVWSNVSSTFELAVTLSGPASRFGHRVAASGDLAVVLGSDGPAADLTRTTDPVTVLHYVNETWSVDPVLLNTGAVDDPIQVRSCAVDPVTRTVALGGYSNATGQGVVRIFLLDDRADAHAQELAAPGFAAASVNASAESVFGETLALGPDLLAVAGGSRLDDVAVYSRAAAAAAAESSGAGGLHFALASTLVLPVQTSEPVAVNSTHWSSGTLPLEFSEGGETLLVGVPSAEDANLAAVVNSTEALQRIGAVVVFTFVPTASPTTSPSASPTQGPTTRPTPHPTGIPTKTPTASPTRAPTLSPSATPTVSPTETPGLGGAAIGGAVVGALFLAAAAGMGVVFALRRRERVPRGDLPPDLVDNRDMHGIVYKPSRYSTDWSSVSSGSVRSDSIASDNVLFEVPAGKRFSI